MTGEIHSNPTLADRLVLRRPAYGTYTVTIAATGYVPPTADPSPSPSPQPDDTLDVTLDPETIPVEGTIYGTITGSDTGTGIPATLVFTETTTSETHTGPTLEDGWYYANTLSYGTWDSVSISSPGYQTAIQGPFTLTAEDPEVNLDLALDPDAPVVEGASRAPSPARTPAPASRRTSSGPRPRPARPTPTRPRPRAGTTPTCRTAPIPSRSAASATRTPTEAPSPSPSPTPTSPSMSTSSPSSLGSVTGTVRDSISGTRSPASRCTSGSGMDPLSQR